MEEPKQAEVIADAPKNDESVFDETFADRVKGIFKESKNFYTAGHINSGEIKNLRSAVNAVKILYPQETEEFDQTLLAEHAAKYKPAELVQQGLSVIKLNVLTHFDVIRESQNNPENTAQAKEALTDTLTKIIGCYASGRKAGAMLNNPNNNQNQVLQNQVLGDVLQQVNTSTESIKQREDFKRMIENNSPKKLADMALSKNCRELVNELARQSKLLKQQQKQQDKVWEHNIMNEKKTDKNMNI